MKDWKYFRGLIRLAREAKAQTGKPLLHQFREILHLRQVQLGPHDYYFYRLFDDRRFTLEQKMQYTNWRFQFKVYRQINDPAMITKAGLLGGWEGAVDKVLFHCIMSAAGLRTPQIIAIFDPSRPFFSGIQILGTHSQLAHFVESRRDQPFFAKPAREGTGHGAMAVESVSDRAVHLSNGTTMDFDSFLSEVVRHERVIFQERLWPHPILKKAIGRTVSTVRVVVLVRPSSSEIHRAILRIPVGKNMVDNFEGGKTGNLLAWVDPETGEVQRVYQGTGLDQIRITHHPDTGELLQGLRLPGWEIGLDLVRKASRVLVGMPFQAWDLAFTDTDPVLVEVNDESSQDILNLPGPPGLLDEELTRFLQEHEVHWTYPPLAKNPLGASGKLPKPRLV